MKKQVAKDITAKWINRGVHPDLVKHGLGCIPGLQLEVAREFINLFPESVSVAKKNGEKENDNPSYVNISFKVKVDMSRLNVVNLDCKSSFSEKHSDAGKYIKDLNQTEMNLDITDGDYLLRDSDELTPTTLSQEEEEGEPPLED